MFLGDYAYFAYIHEISRNSQNVPQQNSSEWQVQCKKSNKKKLRKQEPKIDQIIPEDILQLVSFPEGPPPPGFNDQESVDLNLGNLNINNDSRQQGRSLL